MDCILGLRHVVLDGISLPEIHEYAKKTMTGNDLVTSLPNNTEIHCTINRGRIF